MASILSRLSGVQRTASTEPRDIFMSLPRKAKGYEYPRDVQTEVWKQWYEVRNEKNCVIKMNTGSGKTVVGLIILQSCLNEGKGPAVYIVPDNFLVKQVCEEANNLGIAVTEDRDDFLYNEGKAILVTTIYHLVNGRSVFGMRSGNNYPIGSALLDDVHACLDTISSQFSINIPWDHELREKLIRLFAEQWKLYNDKSYYEIVERNDPTKIELLPFWLWQNKSKDVYRLISEYNNAEESNSCIFYNFPLIKDALDLCDCFISKNGIEIIPDGTAISKIKSFVNAQRHIYMTATLSDDSVFSSALGLEKKDVQRIIVPENANDLGDRLILFPRHLNSAITNDEIRNKIYKISSSFNVLVIVPSFERARYWDATGQRTINKENIQAAISKMKTATIGLVVLVGRYDGIDLPDNACRMLVIDGLPPLKNAKEKYINSIDPASSVLAREQIQRIEQGMGRGVRSNSDSCCIVLMGDNLADVLIRNNGIAYFSNATTEQYNLSKELWNELRRGKTKPTIDDIFELADFSLNRDLEWIQISKERLADVKYTSQPQFDNKTLSIRKAFEFASLSNWGKAIEWIDRAIEQEAKDSTKGYLLQVKAKYVNKIDESQAQQLLLSAKQLNENTITPIEGISYEKTFNHTEQSRRINEYISNKGMEPNDFIIFVDTILSDLSFNPNAEAFESALKQLGTIIGFVSTRPDKQTHGKGPDNLWAIGKDKYLVIECKSGSIATTISKDYCNQLGGSMRWFNDEYGERYEAYPIIIHPSSQLDCLATAVPNMRVIEKNKLDLLKKAVKSFVSAIAQPLNWKDESRIKTLLTQYKLCNSDIIGNYTLAVKQ